MYVFLSQGSQPWGWETYTFLCIKCPSPLTSLTVPYSAVSGDFRHHLLHEALPGCPWFMGSFAHCPELPLQLTKVTLPPPTAHVLQGTNVEEIVSLLLIPLWDSISPLCQKKKKKNSSSTKIHVIRLYHPLPLFVELINHSPVILLHSLKNVTLAHHLFLHHPPDHHLLLLLLTSIQLKRGPMTWTLELHG